jgi:hypothetical protein
MIKIFRLGLVSAVVCAFILITQSTASAVTLPFPAVPSTGLPVIGGLVDSLVGIATGTAYGAGGAVLAVVSSLTGI